MRALVDESLPIAFARELVGHDVSTVRDQEWLGLRNGVLLRAAATAGFDAIVTADRAIRHQQNLTAIGIAVILITRVRNRMSDLRPLISQVLRALESAKPGEIVEVSPSRREQKMKS